MELTLFTTETCHNCPPIKEFLENYKNQHQNIKINFINAGQPQGLDIAREKRVSRVPTLIINDTDKEIARFHTLEEAEEYLTKF
ncbi:hypothetical protein A2483_01085 [Candidatus Peregrinibacteria bacterium RIFOXYC2_FULL_33_13]|nr:MAG: hypothetical protein UR27_C0005G0023 [Candidatus Peregrinibacteria bacterium GW2011_GWA2_33_10]KKP39281.1 MAG: hypothetical protein UR30_C0011G0024 [Candidatus Peregrinibacteria bacterium GW2011_GWC2_33_13]OGJ53721.1 MAG: hypothetical protein A2483_01085 [Candidatus Peregrinibacteria bacterium RIFOXYC2_FULL_33_13]